MLLLLLLAMEPVQIACFCLHTSFNVGPTNSLGVDILDEKRLTKSRNPLQHKCRLHPPKDNEQLDGLEITEMGIGNLCFRSARLGRRLTRKWFGWFKFDCNVWGGGDYYTVGIVPGEPRQWQWLFAFASACMYIESSTSK